ncbi:MAG: hypothetical protein GC160_10200 [Acidobacteria bacterium]|nr:hypothetical protein [Acidobacteriota bacterium]
MRFRLLLLCAALLEAGFLAIRGLGDLGGQVPNYLLYYLLSCCAYLTAVWAACLPGPPMRPAATALIWTAALVFRFTVLPMTAGLSDDLARYRWQGRLQAAGGNPYLAAPADPEWSGLRDETWPRVTRKDLASVYGPLLELSYRASYEVARRITDDPVAQERFFKFPFAALELGVGWAVWLLLRLSRLPPERLLIYLWSPLVVVELWAQGHNDSLAMLLVVLALAAARAARLRRAWACLTGAALAKLWPAALAPLLLFRGESEGPRPTVWSRAAAAWVAAPLIALAVWPYAGAVLAAGDVLEGFAGGWQNNDSLYGWILAWSGDDPRQAAARVGLLWLACATLLWFTAREREQAALWSIVALLLLAANCFPWYLCWFAPLLALYPNPALLLWTALAGLAYHVVTDYAILGVWEELAFYRRLEYAPVLALLALEALRRLTPRRTAAPPVASGGARPS